MTVIFLAEAEQELLEATLYYEQQVSGLGKKFSEEAQRSITHIEQFPLINQKISNDIRRKLVKRFPFAVLYSIENDIVLIIAVMHLKRKPYYWKNRLSL